eukprot:scaffold64302_cov82-Phaeocystis_antarctica.AAC.4
MTPCWSGRMPVRGERRARIPRDGGAVRDRWRARARRACCVCCEGVDVRRVRSAVAVSSEVGPQRSSMVSRRMFGRSVVVAVSWVPSAAVARAAAAMPACDATRPRGAFA